MRRWLFAILLFSFALSACGSSSSSAASEEVSAVETEGAEEGSVVVVEEQDDRVSQSAGEEGGVVVLWPRVMGLPESEPTVLQAHMVELARRVFPNRPVDVRPDPERVCPRGGCRGVSLGALLVAQDGNCATVAVVGRPGESEMTLLPWAGRLTIRDRAIPVREPPESHVTLHDSVRCTELERRLDAGDSDVEAALRQAAP